MIRSYANFGLCLSSDTAPVVDFPASASSAGIDAAVSTEPVRLTNGKRDTTEGRYISGTESTAKVTTLAFPKAVGMILFGALGVDTKTSVVGKTGYYKHVISMGETLPELSFTQQIGASNATIQKLAKAKVSSLNISAEGVTPPSVSVDMTGTEVSWLSSTSWDGPDDDIDEWFTSAGATVQMVLNGSTPTTPPAYITLSSFSATIDNPVTAAKPFGSVVSSAVVEGACTVSAELSGTTTSTEVYRIVKTGTSAGTSVSSSIVTGALQITFPHISDADQSLVVKIPCIPWNCDAMNVDVEGGPFDLKLSTDGAIVANGSSITFELQNKYADAYSD